MSIQESHIDSAAASSPVYVDEDGDESTASSIAPVYGDDVLMSISSDGVANEAPADPCKVAYMIFFLQGMGMLFPWNVFITAENYFHFRFCGTSFEGSFENFFAIGFNISSVIGFFVTLRYSKVLPINKIVIIPFLAITVLFAITDGFVQVDSMGANLLFALTMIIVLGSGMATAFLQSGLFGLAGLFPAQFVQGVMTGQGLAGLTVATMNIVTLAAGPRSKDDVCDSEYSDLKDPAFFYFMMAVLLCLVCVCGYLVLIRMPITRFYAPFLAGENDDIKALLPRGSGRDDDYMPNALGFSDDGKSESGVVDGSLGEKPASGALQTSLLGVVDHVDAEGRHFQEIDVYDNRMRSQSVSQTDASVAGSTTFGQELEKDTSNLSLGDLWELYKLVKIPATAVWLTFTVTLMVFPAVTAKIKSVNDDSDDRFYNDLFTPFSFIMFNAGDTAGRLLAGWKIVFTPRNIWIPAVVRVIFIPLFLLCNIPGDHMPVAFKTDVAPNLIMAVFAVSNGYLGSLCMMFGPAQVEQSKQRAVGSLMGAMLVIGLFSGSLLSFLLLPLTGN